MQQREAASKARIRLGIVGGGPGSLIGPVHLMAARLDGEFELVCGAFSRNPQRAQLAAQLYGVDPRRSYESFDEMFRRERARPNDGMRCVVIATPNDSHLQIATAALDNGFHVLSDKPATRTVTEAEALAQTVRTSACVYGLTYTYSGYPMVREARAICRDGRLGRIRKVMVEYLQGWLAEPVERQGNRQAVWRTDPSQAGAGGCIADIGVHAFHLLEFVVGHRVSRVRSDVGSIVEGRVLDDDFTSLVRLDNDIPGVIAASQVAAGEVNGLRLRVYGERGGIDWSQEIPDRLIVRWLDRPMEVVHAGANVASLSAQARDATRLPARHPEGYIEALANIYRDFAAAIRGRSQTGSLPSIDDGLRGMHFVECVLRSSGQDGQWVQLPP